MTYLHSTEANWFEAMEISLCGCATDNEMVECRRRAARHFVGSIIEKVLHPPGAPRLSTESLGGEGVQGGGDGKEDGQLPDITHWKFSPLSNEKRMSFEQNHSRETVDGETSPINPRREGRTSVGMGTQTDPLPDVKESSPVKSNGKAPALNVGQLTPKHADADNGPMSRGGGDLSPVRGGPDPSPRRPPREPLAKRAPKSVAQFPRAAHRHPPVRETPAPISGRHQKAIAVGGVAPAYHETFSPIRVRQLGKYDYLTKGYSAKGPGATRSVVMQRHLEKQQHQQQHHYVSGERDAVEEELAIIENQERRDPESEEEADLLRRALWSVQFGTASQRQKSADRDHNNSNAQTVFNMLARSNPVITEQEINHALVLFTPPGVGPTEATDFLDDACRGKHYIDFADFIKYGKRLRNRILAYETFQTKSSDEKIALIAPRVLFRPSDDLEVLRLQLLDLLRKQDAGVATKGVPNLRLYEMIFLCEYEKSLQERAPSPRALARKSSAAIISSRRESIHGGRRQSIGFTSPRAHERRGSKLLDVSGEPEGFNSRYDIPRPSEHRESIGSQRHAAGQRRDSRPRPPLSHRMSSPHGGAPPAGTKWESWSFEQAGQMTEQSTPARGPTPYGDSAEIVWSPTPHLMPLTTALDAAQRSGALGSDGERRKLTVDLGNTSVTVRSDRPYKKYIVPLQSTNAEAARRTDEEIIGKLQQIYSSQEVRRRSQKNFGVW